MKEFKVPANKGGEEERKEHAKIKILLEMKIYFKLGLRDWSSCSLIFIK